MTKIKPIKNKRQELIYPITSVSAIEGLPEELEKKQNKLVSGENIKKINGEDVLGGGNIVITGDGTAITIDSELSSDSENPVENRAVTRALNDKQEELESGVNIKTINGESILGSGNIIAGDPNAVKYTEQELTEEQKAQARSNIDAGTYSKPNTGIPASDLESGVVTDVIRYSEQQLTQEQQAQARTNIGAVSEEEYINPFKGMYGSLETLETTYPNPQLGDYAYVKNSGTPATANIYNVVGGEWTDTNIVLNITDMESVFPTGAKLTLLHTLEKVAWIDENGGNYLSDLRESLLGSIDIVSISAIFSAGETAILDSMTLESLRSYLTVTATFSDETQKIVTGYQLSGLMTVGTNTITVSYMGETTAFTVNVKHNYAGNLSTWTIRPGNNSTGEYVNGYIRMKCNNTTAQSGFGCWCVDAAKSTWGQTNGKKLRFRIKVNSISGDLGAFGPGIYSTSSPSSLGNDYARRSPAGTWILADDGYYYYDKVMDLADFTYGTYTPTNNSAFGLYCYARALNDYIEIYDAQIFEVE